MSKYQLPKALTDLIDALGVLPGVGPRSAERFASYLLRADDNLGRKLIDALNSLKSGVKTCPVTFALMNADEDVSPLYADKSRDKQLVAVVEDPLDIVALEKTEQFDGTYHVLGGVISPIDGVGPEKLHIPELIQRLGSDDVKEVILATNASVEGESTALYIQRQIDEAGLKPIISRLARGIPAGIDLEYADQITLSHALKGRQVL
ncbi:MAG TPA: recombination mediator RecR [Candidatus Saccharimonadales bacterium]|nr:recombination mediator RecR [Candidatus Saccharimonadales bacterium]